MKQLKNYITEKLHISKFKKEDKYHYHPKDKKELRELLKKLIKERGNNADLNDIDTSNIDDMSYLFNGNLLSIVNPDVSKWNVSNVKSMVCMFGDCIQFNNDLGDWDVSNVEEMKYMFDCCKNFEGKGLEKWNPKNLKNTYYMFRETKVSDELLNKLTWYNK